MTAGGIYLAYQVLGGTRTCRPGENGLAAVGAPTPLATSGSVPQEV